MTEQKGVDVELKLAKTVSYLTPHPGEKFTARQFAA